jgi:ubiquinol-cytochrome c reductase cytochrome c subunit
VLFLTSRRRHPLAGLVVVLLGLVAAGVLYAAISPASADDASTSDTELIAQGRALYVVGCSSCHGMHAEGVVTKGDRNYGPPLVGVGAASADFQLKTGRMPLPKPGTQEYERPPLFTDDEIAALSAYIASLAPGPAIPSDDEANPDLGDAAYGRQLWQTNCTACHGFAGNGGAMPEAAIAPSLSDTEYTQIIEAMLVGPGPMPSFSDGVMTPEDKTDIVAYLAELRDQPSYGGNNLGGTGAVAEGVWGWIVGVGGMVLVAVWIGNNGVRAGKKRP